MFKLFVVVSRFRNYLLTIYYRRRLNSKINYLRYPCEIQNHRLLVLGDNFCSKENLRIDLITAYKRTGQQFTPQLIIGNDVAFNKNVHIGCCGKIEIGDNCLFASNIYISDHSHGDLSSEFNVALPYLLQDLVIKNVKLGNNCWIGENVSILPGVEIGEACIVGANSVVTKSFNSHTILAGNPAKAIKRYNPSTEKWERISK